MLLNIESIIIRFVRLSITSNAQSRLYTSQKSSWCFFQWRVYGICKTLLLRDKETHIITLIGKLPNGLPYVYFYHFVLLQMQYIIYDKSFTFNRRSWKISFLSITIIHDIVRRRNGDYSFFLCYDSQKKKENRDYHVFYPITKSNRSTIYIIRL